MTQQDKSILSKELRGITVGNMCTVIVGVATACYFGHTQKTEVMDKLSVIETKVEVSNACYNNLQKQVDRHELLLTKK